MHHQPVRSASAVRRLLGATFALGLLVVGCSSSDDGNSTSDTRGNGDGDQTETTTIRMGIVPVSGQIMTYNAIANGTFEEQGIELDLTEAPSGNELVASLVGGSLDVVFAPYASVMQAAGAGHDLVFIAANHADNAEEQEDGTFTGYAGMGVLDDSGITSAEDLAGKTVALNGLHNQNHLATLVWLEEAGVDPESVTLIEIPFPNQGLALREGQVDAAFMADPFITLETQEPGITVFDNPFGAIDPEHFPSTGWLMTRAWAEDNPDLVERFRAANAAATEAASALTADERAALLEEHFDLPAAIGAQVNVGHWESELPLDRLNTLLDLMKEHGMVENEDLTVDDIILP